MEASKVNERILPDFEVDHVGLMYSFMRCLNKLNDDKDPVPICQSDELRGAVEWEVLDALNMLVLTTDQLKPATETKGSNFLSAWNDICLLPKEKLTDKKLASDVEIATGRNIVEAITDGFVSQFSGDFDRIAQGNVRDRKDVKQVFQRLEDSLATGVFCFTPGEEGLTIEFNGWRPAIIASV